MVLERDLILWITISIFISLYLPLIFLVIPSVVLLITSIAKIFSCLCCFRRNTLFERANAVPNALLPHQELPDRAENPQD